MIESHPEEESWEGRRSRELEEKKLFVLHSENQRLSAQQDSFQLVLADYSHKIEAFNEKSRKLEEENTRLQSEVEALTRRCASSQETLAKRNEEYCNLYNYLFTEKRSSLQDAFLREIDLSQKLTEIQQESDAQIIAKLKETVRQKNEEVLRMARRVSELSESLLSSAFEYQEKIFALKAGNERLKESAETKPTEGVLYEDVGEYCYKNKIQSLNKQIDSYQLEITSYLSEIATLRKLNSHLQQKKNELEIELQSLKAHMSSFDGNIYQIFSENSKLKAEVLRERLKTQEIGRNSPEYARQEDFQQILGKERQAKQTARLRQELQKHTIQIDSLRNQQKTLLEEKLSVQQKIESLRLVAASAIEKLKNFISTYVPIYYRKGGLESYDLTKEEQQMISNRNGEMALQRAYSEINKKGEEAKKAKIKLAQVQQTASAHLHRIKILEQKLEYQEKDNAVLLNTLQELVEDKKRRQSIDNAYAYEPYQDDQLNRINDEEVDEPAREALEKGHKIRTEILEQAIQDLQEDRTQLVNIIKGKEAMIADLSAEINVLRDMANITTINIQTFPTQPPTQIQDQASDQQERNAFVDVSGLKEELRRLSLEYKQERQVLERQHQQKEALSLNRYSNLLRLYEELAEKHRALQASLPQSNQQLPDQVPPLSPIEPTSEIIHHHQQHPQADQPALSEAAIENFTDTLKKYEKEFNRFVVIYQTQMRKAIEGSVGSEHAQSEDDSSLPDHDRLAPLLAQHQHTASALQELLAQKQQEADLLQAQLNEARNELSHQTSTLTARLEQAETALATLRATSLSGHFQGEFSSQESTNAAFLMLNSKNKELDSLKAAYEKLRRSYEIQSKETARLAQMKGLSSPLQNQEQKLLRELFEEEDLAGVLSAVARHLQ